MKKFRAAIVTMAAAASLAVMVPSSAQAAEECKSAGQAYICDFGITTHKMPDGGKQVFAVAPQRNVVTRWEQSDGSWSHWESMSGIVDSKVRCFDDVGPGKTRIVADMNGGVWERVRLESGTWTPWHEVNPG
ncbi:hypothetical protein ACH4SK_37630 [Streptomyces inhibens]|uniref:hypothetical protein n=1 Tax=Streptomyces inhibens TaxID=2293571 RepID=UPI0037BC5041